MIITPGIKLPTTIALTSATPAVPLPVKNVSLTSKVLVASQTASPFSPVTATSTLGAVTYSISPDLPTGLTFNTSTGEITGTSSTSQTTNHTITMTDSIGQTVTSALSLVVAPGTGQDLLVAGSYDWFVPAGVTSISVVCVGGGGAGYWSSSSVNFNGGGGGGLAYVNNITVTPGERLVVSVGAGGSTTGINGGDSFIARNLTVLCRAGGGKASTTSAVGAGGTPVVGLGNAGGSGGTGVTKRGAGGGGAAGYTGKGGNGGSGGTTGSYGQAGAGGGGGGGGGWGATLGSSGFGGKGGGVGVYGQGANGAAGASGNGGASPSPGGAGSGGSGMLYGGAGAGGSSAAGDGAVRIIWPGDLRQFPSTRTADE